MTNGLIYSNNNIYSNIYLWKQTLNDMNSYYTDNKIYLGFNNTDNDYRFKVDGNVYVSGNIIGLSDIRHKTNISNIDDALIKVDNLKGVSYNLKKNERRQLGLIAQDVEKIIPEVVYLANNEDKAIAYDNLIAVIIEAIKEISVRLKKLEEKINI